jgi:MFS family permease
VGDRADHPVDEAPPARPPAESLWRHRDFMKLWSAQTVSQFGSQVTLLALPLTAILVLRASAFQVGLLGTVEFLPFILIGLPAGVWVDRLRRRPFLIFGDVGRAVALGSIPVAYGLDVLTMGQLYVVAFVSGVLTVFFDVAYQSYLPSLVGREHLVEGNGKLEISRSAAQIGGPGLAGGLIEVVRAPVTIAIDALSFVGSALLLLLIRRREEPPSRREPSGGRPKMRQDIAEGLRYVGRHRLLRAIAACTATANLFGNMTQVVLILFAVRQLGMSPGVIGLVFSVASVAALLGAFVSNRLPKRIGVGPAIVTAAAIFSLAGIIVPLSTRSTAVPLLIAWGLLGSFANVLYNVTQVSLRQAITPERLQGRMNATMRFVVWGTIPIGAFVGGALGDSIGLRATLWVGAIGGLTAVVPVLLSGVRTLRTIPEPEPEAVPPAAPIGVLRDPPG